MINKIYCWDSIDVLDLIKDESIHLIFTSPPYNVWHKYEWYNDNLSEIEYEIFLEKVFIKLYNKLVSWWRLAINVPFAVKNMETKKTIFVSNIISNIAHKIWFIDYEIITWHKWVDINHFQWNNTAWGSWKSPSNPVCRPMSEAIFIFSKNKTKLDWDKENIDITSNEFKEWTKNSWYLYDNFKFDNLLCVPNKKNKKEHPATFPIELAERIIKLYSYIWNTILDPFNWLWNTTIAAKNLWRNYIWIDQSKEYCEKALITMWEKKDELIEYNNQIKVSNLENLVNTSNIKNEEINNWFYLKESYSENIIDFIIKNYFDYKPKYIFDPFSWAWSSLVYWIKNNINVIWFEVNPIAYSYVKAKINKYSNEDLILLENIINKIEKLHIKKYKYPDWEPINKYISEEINNTYFSIQSIFNKIKNNIVKDLLNSILNSLLENVWNYKKDWNWIKFKKNNINSTDFLNLLSDKIKKIIIEIKNINYTSVEQYIFNDSSINSFNKYDFPNFDLFITSPPYANMFDYFESNKIELWMSWEIKNYSDWWKLKKSAMRSNMNAKLINNEISSKSILLNDTLLELSKKIKNNEIKEKRLIIMLNNYFYDMEKLLLNSFNKINKNWIICIVVANSWYWWTVVETDNIIKEIAESIGYSFINLIKARNIRSSSQQAKIIDKEKMRESILIFKKF